LFLSNIWLFSWLQSSNFRNHLRNDWLTANDISRWLTIEIKISTPTDSWYGILLSSWSDDLLRRTWEWNWAWIRFVEIKFSYHFLNNWLRNIMSLFLSHLTSIPTKNSILDIVIWKLLRSSLMILEQYSLFGVAMSPSSNRIR